MSTPAEALRAVVDLVQWRRFGNAAPERTTYRAEEGAQSTAEWPDAEMRLVAQEVGVIELYVFDGYVLQSSATFTHMPAPVIAAAVMAIIEERVP